MSDRDRLIELIVNADTYDSYECKLCTKNDVSCRRCGAEKLADHLLANGVIVPPCKVGQTAYYLFQYSDKRVLPFVRKAKIKRIYCGNSKMQFLVDCELKDTKEKGIIRTWYFTDFGKTAFLTKEKAEQALEGMKNG